MRDSVHEQMRVKEIFLYTWSTVVFFLKDNISVVHVFFTYFSEMYT